jgi:hypothetical protein
MLHGEKPRVVLLGKQAGDVEKLTHYTRIGKSRSTLLEGSNCPSETALPRKVRWG